MDEGALSTMTDFKWSSLWFDGCSVDGAPRFIIASVKTELTTASTAVLEMDDTWKGPKNKALEIQVMRNP